MKARKWSGRRLVTAFVRRSLVGPGQKWRFEPPAPSWAPPRLVRTSLYLHVPFCRQACPYCPYTKVAYRDALVGPFTRAALAEVDWWADAVGPSEVGSIYIGGGTPTLAMGAVAAILDRIRGRFRVAGPIAVETNPADVSGETVAALRQAGVSLVSIGIQSFEARLLRAIGRGYDPATAERALGLLGEGGFDAVNADLMFALPGQSVGDVTSDLDRASALGATQVTAYPLFTFPYTTVGAHRRLTQVQLPALGARRAQYRAICDWSRASGFERVSVWGFRRGPAPRYSSVTRDGYIGIGPGAGSHLPDGFTVNTFDLEQWAGAADGGRGTVALRLPFSAALAGWWWLYWRLYETRVPRADIDVRLGGDAGRVRRWLGLAERAGFAERRDGATRLTDAGAFWLHLAQNYFALDYVNALWTSARREPWPAAIAI